MCASTRYAPTGPDSGRVLGHTGGPLHVVVKFIRSKATGHTTSTDPSRSHYITSVGGRLMPTHRRRKPQARRCRAAVVVTWLPPFQTPIASLSPFSSFVCRRVCVRVLCSLFLGRRVPLVSKKGAFFDPQRPLAQHFLAICYLFLFLPPPAYLPNSQARSVRARAETNHARPQDRFLKLGPLNARRFYPTSRDSLVY